MAERDDGVGRELRVVHPLGQDDLAGTIGAFAADPTDIASLAGIDLGRRLGGDEMAILMLRRARQGFQQRIERHSGAVGHGEAERALDGAVVGTQEVGHGSAPWRTAGVSRLVGTITSRLVGTITSRLVGTIISRLVGTITSRLVGTITSRLVGTITSRLVRYNHQPAGRYNHQPAGKVQSPAGW